MSMRKWLARHQRELKHHRRRLTGPGRDLRRAVAFLSDDEGWSGSSGDLRAKALEPEIAKFGWRLIGLSPRLSLSQRRRFLALDRPEVIFLQQSRHPLNRPRYYPGIPCVFDADDSDFLDPNCIDQVIECCRESVVITAGSRFLAESFRPYNPNVSIVWTCSYLHPSPTARPVDEREPVVTWASASPMRFPEEAKLVREVLLRLAQRSKFSFRLYGVGPADRASVEEYLEPIRKAGVATEVFAPMPYEQFVRSLESASVGLHPVCMSNPFSRGRSFGKLLAYLVAGVSIVTSDVVDHPLFFRDGVTGMLVDDDVEKWTDRCERLLADPGLRGRMAEAARVDFEGRLTTERAAELVAGQLNRAVDLSKVRPVEAR